MVVYFPPMMIMILNQATLFLHVEASETRLSLCASALLSTVMYHVTIMSSTPSSAQDATRADAFMVLCYSVNAFTWLMVLLQYSIGYTKKKKTLLSSWVKESFWYRTRLVGPPLCMILALCTAYVTTPFAGATILAVTFLCVVGLLILDYKIFARGYRERTELGMSEASTLASLGTTPDESEKDAPSARTSSERHSAAEVPAAMHQYLQNKHGSIEMPAFNRAGLSFSRAASFSAASHHEGLLPHG